MQSAAIYHIFHMMHSYSAIHVACHTVLNLLQNEKVRERERWRERERKKERERDGREKQILLKDNYQD